MKKFVVVCGLGFAGLVAMGLVLSGRARTEVAVDRAVEQIDRVLDVRNVSRKEIAHVIESLNGGLVNLRKERIRAQVRLDQARERLKSHQQRVVEIDAALEVLRGHIEDESSATLAGRTYSPREVASMAEQLLKERTQSVGLVSRCNETCRRLEQVTGTLESKEEQFRSQISEVEHRIAVIDADQHALRAMESATSTFNGNEPGLNSGMQQLVAMVNDLHAEVTAGLYGQELNWSMSSNLPDIDSADAILSAVASPDDLLSRIDSVLEQPVSVAQAD